jgi:hypothetical protein
MTVEPPVDLDQLEIGDELSLIVAWKRGQGFEGGEVRVADAVAEHLTEACWRTIERIEQRELRAYSPDMHLEDEEVLVVRDDELVADSPLAEVVLPAAPLDLLSSRSLPDRRLYLYAVVVPGPDGPEAPVAFVRRANPQAAARSGRILALLGDALQRVDRPAFWLDEAFDLVISEDGIVALDQRLFEVLFKETPALQQKIPEWVDEIDRHLPIAGDGAQQLAERCETDGRLRRRLRAIAERGHLAQVTIEQIREHLREVDLDEDDFIEGDELKVDESNPFQLVYMLNEDFFRGGLTETDFRSDRKSPR